MATVRKRGKVFYARFRDVDGWKEIKGYSDKKETLRYAQQLEDKALAVRNGSVDPQAEARRMERTRPAMEHVNLFAAHMQSNRRNPNHIQYTVKDITRCLEHSRAASASALTLPMIDAWRSFCMNTGYPKSAVKGEATTENQFPTPDSPKTANRRIASVRAWLRYLHSISALDRVILENYKMLHTKGHETKRRRALSQAEVDALISKCPDENRKELYRFATLTGFRRSECASMTPASFNFDARTITLNARDAKRKTDHQIIPMHSRLIEPLKKLCQGAKADAPIFRVPNKTDVVPTLHADCKLAEIDTTDIDFHALRHTFCSLLAAQNIRPEILMKLARHRDIATTMKYYVHFRSDDERAALERI